MGLTRGLATLAQPRWEFVELILEDGEDVFSYEREFQDPETIEYWVWYCPVCGDEVISDSYLQPAPRTECTQCGRKF